MTCSLPRPIALGSPAGAVSQHDEDPGESRRIDAVRGLALLDTAPEPGFDEAVRLASMICRTPTSLISIVDRQRVWLKARIGFEPAEIRREDAFCKHVLGLKDLLVIPDTRQDPRFAANPMVAGAPHIHFYAAMPLQTPDGYTIGSLCVVDTEPRVLTAEQQTALEILGRQVTLQIELRHRMKLLNQANDENGRIQAELRIANERLSEMAMTDALTRLRNRRAFDQRMTQEFTAARNGVAPLSLLLIDVDNFKSYNDAFGHATGDDILCIVARILVQSSRIVDLVARHGGEEFAILLPNTAQQPALILAERIRAAIEVYPWPNRPVTVSLGLAAWTPEMPDTHALFQAADDALYQAKSLGRNRTAVDAGPLVRHELLT